MIENNGSTEQIQPQGQLKGPRLSPTHKKSPTPKLAKFSADHSQKLLRKYRAECKEETLSLECAAATTLMALAGFAEAFEQGPRKNWSSHWGSVLYQLRNLQHALQVEYPSDLP